MPHYCGLVFCQLSLQLANWLSVQWMGELFAWLDGSCYIHLFSPKKPFTSIVSRAVNRPSFAVFARWLISLTRSPIKPTYRVSHIETYTLSAYKCHKGNSKKVISKKFRKWFHSCTCILPDYVSDESSKEFWKNSHFENLRAGFLGRW